MKLSLITLAVSASAFVVSDKVNDASRAVRQGSCRIKQVAKDLTNDVRTSLYTKALTLDPEDSSDEFLDIQGGQHTFHLLEKDHPHPPKKGKKHPPPHKNPHDQRDKSIYEFIAESEYFTILHDIIKGDEHIVAELNKTSANLTLFAPTDGALKKYKDHAPPVEYLRKALLYHLLPDIYPAGRVLKSKTLETLYEQEGLGQQRLAVDINFRGLTLNYYARVIYIDVFTSNGVVHAIDNLLFPPPPIYDIAEVLPSTFSTFINAAWKTGLVDTLNATEHSTIFAPSNFAFASLGARINAYLFSTRGTATLTKLLKYHIVPDVLFYSDYVEDVDSESTKHDEDAQGLVAHYEFKTLEGANINVDVGEWGRFKSIVFNGRTIGTSDIPAKNGVLQKLKNGIILPYKKTLDVKSVDELSIEEFDSLFDGEADQTMLYTVDDEEEEADTPEWLMELLSLF